MNADKMMYGPLAVRIGLGVLFVAAGVMKLMMPSGFIGMLAGMMPMATVLGWLVIAAEVLAGAAVLVGWRVRLTLWPLFVILAVATVTVWIPQWSANPMAPVVVLLHVASMASLLSLFFTGAGAKALDDQ
jgi:putative oxidoreductase